MEELMDRHLMGAQKGEEDWIKEEWSSKGRKVNDGQVGMEIAAWKEKHKENMEIAGWKEKHCFSCGCPHIFFLQDYLGVSKFKVSIEVST